MMRQNCLSSHTPIRAGGSRRLRAVCSAPPAIGQGNAAGGGDRRPSSSPTSSLTSSLQDVDMVSYASLGTDDTMHTAPVDIPGYGPAHPRSVLGVLYGKAMEGDAIAAHKFLRLMNGRTSSGGVAENLKPCMDAEKRDDAISGRVQTITNSGLFRQRVERERLAMEADDAGEVGDDKIGMAGGGRIVHGSGISPILRTPQATAGSDGGDGGRRDGVPADIMTAQRSVGSPGGLSIHSGSFDDIPGLSVGGKTWLKFVGGAAAFYAGLELLPSGLAHFLVAILISYCLFMYRGAV